MTAKPGAFSIVSFEGDVLGEPGSGAELSSDSELGRAAASEVASPAALDVPVPSRLCTPAGALGKFTLPFEVPAVLDACAPAVGAGAVWICVAGSARAPFAFGFAGLAGAAVS